MHLKNMLVKSTGFIRLPRRFVAQKGQGPFPRVVLTGGVKAESLPVCEPAPGNAEAGWERKTVPFLGSDAKVAHITPRTL